MNGKQLRDHLLSQLQLKNSGTAPLGAKEAVTTAINRALQEIWLAGPDYFRRRKLTINTVASTSGYALPQNIQEVLGPVRIGRKPLTLLAAKGDWLGFGAYYRGETTLDEIEGEPEAYFVERLHRDQTEADNKTINLLLAPTPDGVYIVEYECSTQAPQFDRTNWCDDPTPELGIPQDYVQSILAPVASFFVMESSYFYETDKVQLLSRGYVLGMQALGVADPQVPPLANPKLKKSDGTSS